VADHTSAPCDPGIGDALVDLVCERHVDGLADADAFAPPRRGATANPCVVAARLGADVASRAAPGTTSGVAAARPAGRRGRRMDWFGLVVGEPTGLAFVTVDGAASRRSTCAAERGLAGAGRGALRGPTTALAFSSNAP